MPHVDVTSIQQANKVIAENGGVAVIDCHATWCGPCKMIGPKAVSLSDSKGIMLIKVDVDQAEDLAAKLNVNAMPSFFLVNGDVDHIHSQFVGANQAQLEKMFETATTLKK